MSEDVDDDDGDKEFVAALSDPPAAVALLLARDSNTVSVMVDEIVKSGSHPEIANALVAAIETNPRAAAFAVLELARRKFDLSGTNVVAALRPHLQAESRVAFALLQLGVVEPAVIKRVEDTLENFDSLSTTMSSLRWSVAAGLDPKPLVHIALAGLARDPGSGGAAYAIREFAKAGADMSAAVPELERRTAGDEDDDDYDDAAASALEAIRGSVRS